jgi:uncharacterized membrane protein
MPRTAPSRTARGAITKPLRIVHGHRRLLLCFAVSIAAYLALAGTADGPSRILIAWDIGVILYLGFAYAAIASFDLKRARLRASEQDEGAIAMLALVVCAAIASLAAIVAFLGGAKEAREAHGFYFAFAVATIILSWLLIQTTFALHYAHEFYGEGADRRQGGLDFPGDPKPDYWDFVYFAFVIGMTFQVSDVAVTGKRMRHFVVAHGMVSFFFSVAILALAVNIGSSLI